MTQLSVTHKWCMTVPLISLSHVQIRSSGHSSFREVQGDWAVLLTGHQRNVSGDYIPLLKLVKSLEHLNIIAPIIQSDPTPSGQASSSEVTYFMPCVLQNSTHEEFDKWWASASNPLSPAPLFIRYKCGYAPIGVFPAVIANVTSQRSCHMIYDGIKKNCVQFRFGISDYGTVTLISHPKYYAVHLSSQDFHTQGMSTLKTVTSHMNYSFHVEYQISFECPSHPGRVHLCVVDSADEAPQARQHERLTAEGNAESAFGLV